MCKPPAPSDNIQYALAGQGGGHSDQPWPNSAIFLKSGIIWNQMATRNSWPKKWPNAGKMAEFGRIGFKKEKSLDYLCFGVKI